MEVNREMRPKSTGKENASISQVRLKSLRLVIKTKQLFLRAGSFLIVLMGEERPEILLCLFQHGCLYFFNGSFAGNHQPGCCPGLVAWGTDPSGQEYPTAVQASDTRCHPSQWPPASFSGMTLTLRPSCIHITPVPTHPHKGSFQEPLINKTHF